MYLKHFLARTFLKVQKYGKGFRFLLLSTSCFEDIRLIRKFKIIWYTHGYTSYLQLYCIYWKYVNEKIMLLPYENEIRETFTIGSSYKRNIPEMKQKVNNFKILISNAIIETSKNENCFLNVKKPSNFLFLFLFSFFFLTRNIWIFSISFFSF